MSELVLAETVTLQWAKETTPGTLAAANWKEGQVNPGGLQNWKPGVTLIQRKPLSKRRQVEEGEIVDLDAMPSFVHDVTKDLLDQFGDAIFLAAGSHSGNTGLSYFKPTAVTATGYTVASLGALTNNFLVRARGFTVAGNNGVKVCAGTSTGTEIKAAGLAAETVSGYTPIVEVVGWQGASGDIGIDASGNLTSAASVFTGWNLKVGQWIFLGGDTVANGGLAAESFNTAAYRGWAKVKTIAAALITLERRQWTVGSADAGAAKTIRVWFGRHWRNVASDHADSLTTAALQPNYSLESSLPGAAAAAATSYKYATGCVVTRTQISAPAVNKMEATIDFCGNNFQAPTTTRATGASASEAPIIDATSLFNTAHHVLYLKVAQKSDDTSLLVDVSSWTLDINQNVTPQKQQGTLGNRRKVVGKCEIGINVSGYMVQDDAPKAIRDARQATFVVATRNANGAFLLDAPNVQLTGGDEDYPENGPVTLTTDLMASREATLYNSTAGLSTFPYAPNG